MALRDPATGLSCAETPFYPPQLLKSSDLAICNSCTLEISAPATGTKIYSPRGNIPDGIGINESPLAQLVYNGTAYGLYDTVLWKAGAHRAFNSDTNYDLEMNLYFRSVQNSAAQFAIAIPIMIDNSKPNPYFTELTNQDASKRTYTLESIVSANLPVLMYKGMDLRLRSNASPAAAAQCNDITANITWCILPPAYISSSDAEKIRALSLPTNVAPPAPSTVLTVERCRDMCMVIPSMKIKLQKAPEPEDIYLTRALQCQRIDPTTDVKGDAVYLRKPHTKNTLANELDASAALESALEGTSNTGIRPRDIENMLAVGIAIAIAIIVFCFIAYYVMMYLYKGYLPTVIKEQSIIKAVTDAKDAVSKSLHTP
jgi:hypothetical protein